VGGGLIAIKCTELSTDEQLALAEAITVGMEGKALALMKGDEIVLDQLGAHLLATGEVELIVRNFVSKRNDPTHYSVEVIGDMIVIHSPDPIRAMRERRNPTLPDNVFKCPFCPFVTPYEELYVVHYRSHGFA